MTINIRAATAEQLAEYVSAAQGYSRENAAFYVHPDGRIRHMGVFVTDLNPIAAAMPPGWVWDLDRDSRTPCWLGFSIRHEVFVDYTGNERLDRLRLAALAWEVESKEKR